MSSRAWLGSVVVLGLLGVVGCASPTEEAGGSAAAQSAPADASAGLRFASADYGDYKIVVHEGEVRGSVYSTIGDPEHGGAICSFAFSGHIDEMDNGAEGAIVTAADGFSGPIQGRLRVEKKGEGAAPPELVLELDESPSACMRMMDTKDIRFFGGTKVERAGVAGWAPVIPEKAYFYDAPAGTKRAAYVVAADMITVKTLPNGTVVDRGFVLAEYTNGAGRKTTGYLRYEDLASPWLTGE